MKLFAASDQQALCPVLDPLDRAPGKHRQQADKRLLRMSVHLQAECATEVRNDDPDPVFGNA